MTTVNQLLALANTPFGGALGIMALGLVGFVTGKLHADGEFKRLLSDRDDWKEIALSGTNVAERVTEQLRARRRRAD